MGGQEHSGPMRQPQPEDEYYHKLWNLWAPTQGGESPQADHVTLLSFALDEIYRLREMEKAFRDVLGADVQEDPSILSTGDLVSLCIRRGERIKELEKSFHQACKEIDVYSLNPIFED